MAKFDLLAQLLLNITGYENGINKAKQKTKELTDTIKGVENAVKSVAGFAAGIFAIGGAFEAVKDDITVHRSQQISLIK